MYKIVSKETLNSAVELMEIEAPFVANKCEAGQFIIVRVDEDVVVVRRRGRGRRRMRVEPGEDVRLEIRERRLLRRPGLVHGDKLRVG